MNPIPAGARLWLSIALAPLWPVLETAAAENTGHSSLAEITADNVAQLNLVFSFELPAGTGYGGLLATLCSC
jgi:hypothetical protein